MSEKISEALGTNEIKESKASNSDIIVKNEKQTQDFQQWLELNTEAIKPCAHSIEETEQYFLALYDVDPLAGDSAEMQAAKKDMILNLHRNELQSAALDSEENSGPTVDWKGGPPPAEFRERLHRAILALAKEAEEASAEQFGLVLKGYRVIRNEKSEKCFLQNGQETRKMKEEYLRRSRAQTRKFELFDEKAPDIFVVFEMNSGEIQVTNGGGLYTDLVLFRGVREEDIKERSSRFITYTYALRDSQK